MRVIGGPALLGLALALLACGSAPPPPPAGPTAKQVAARGLPGTGPYRLLIVAGSGVDDLTFYPAWYGFVSHGWTVKIATPTPVGGLSARGVAVPADLTLDAVKPDRFDVLYLPEGAPDDAQTRALIAAFARDRHLAIAPGATKAAKAAGVEFEPASDEEMVRVDRNRISAARPGDLPRLVWTVTAYAADTIRPGEGPGRAGDGNPP